MYFTLGEYTDDIIRVTVRGNGERVKYQKIFRRNSSSLTEKYLFAIVF